MKNLYKVLNAIFWGELVGALLLALVFECGIVPSGLFPPHSELEFIITTVMELATIVLIPTSMRLLKMRKVQDHILQKGFPAFSQWCIIRVFMLTFPLFLNTFLYYAFMQPAFGYMAVILVICLAFVYPSKSRCEDDARRLSVEE